VGRGRSKGKGTEDYRKKNLFNRVVTHSLEDQQLNKQKINNSTNRRSTTQQTEDQQLNKQKTNNSTNRRPAEQHDGRC
jgi:hypothetical protein